MSGVTPNGSGTLPLSLELRVDAVCQEFEKAWKLASGGGDRPRLETFVDAVPERAHRALLVELLRIEAHYRRRLGEVPQPEDYRERFPGVDVQQLDAALALPGSADKTARKDHDTPEAARGPAEATPPTLPGYEILEELGRGGMGIVYRARQLRLNRVVALKMILAGGPAGARALARHRQEAQAAAQLQHPHIVQIYEIGEHAGRPFLALEYVPGGSLDQRFRGRPLPGRDAARLVEMLAGAVQFAHEHGVVHRDLKPANVLLTADDMPKITDFGLAKILGDDDEGLTCSGDVIGTPSYMAPEQASGQPGVAGPACDVYGLGALLYELLTGQPPFQGSTPVATVLQVRYQEPVSPSRLQPDCPRDLVTICLKCLEKDPSRRYATAAALADDLRRFGEGRPILARPVTFREQLAKWVRRRPAVAALAGGLAVVTFVGLIASTWMWRRAERERGEAVEARNNEAEARQDAVARLYASQVALAYSEFGAHRLQRAEQILESCRQLAPDQCRWEWDYLKRQCRTQLLTLEGHTQRVNCLAYSPDGRWLASCGGRWNGDEPGEVKLWDAATGKLARNLPGPRKAVYRVAFHPDGAWLAAISLDHNVWRWSIPDGKPLPPLRHDGPITGLSVRPDGKALAICDFAGRVRMWDLASGQSRTHTVHTGNVYDVAYSPDSKLLASAGRDATVVLRDAQTGEPLHWLYHPSDARRLAFSPDGRLLASGSYDGAVRIWDLAGQPTALVTHHVGNGNLVHLTFSPDGQRLACCVPQGDVRVWNVRGQRQDLNVNATGGAATCAAFSPDARWLATAKEDYVIRVWDYWTYGSPRLLAEHNAYIVALAVSPDGQTGALAGGYNWSLPPGSPTLRLVDLASGKSRGDLPGHSSWLTSVAFHPRGTQLVSGSQDKTAIVWDPDTRRALRTLRGHTDAILGVAYCLQGAVVATASADGSVRLWDAESGEPRGQLVHPQAVLGVAASDDGRLLATAGADQVVRVWDAGDGRLLHALRGHNAPVNAVAFQPGSHWLASADEDHSLRFWDADAGIDLTRLRPVPELETAWIDNAEGARPAREDRDSRLAFSPDGRRLVFLGHGRALQIWDVPGRHLLITLPEPDPGHVKLCAAFSTNGRKLYCAEAWRLKVRDATPPEDPADPDGVRATVLAWHKAQGMTAYRERSWYGVDFHFSRLLEADPADAQGFARRSTARAALGRTPEADADHARALALAPKDPAIWNWRGDAFVYQNRWREAEQAFAQAVAGNGGLNALYYQAIARLGGGDLAAYRELCQDLLKPERFGRTRSAGEARSVLYIVTPLAGEFDPDTLLRLGELAGSGGNERLLCAACYRVGGYRDAVDHYIAALRSGWRPRAWDSLFRAMAHQRLNESDAARRSLERARHWIAEADRVDATPTELGEIRWYHWMERVEVHALLREAEALIGR